MVSPKGYAIFANCVDNAAGVCTGPASTITFAASEFTITNGGETGLAGGTKLTLTGKGLNTLKTNNNKVNVCGHACSVDFSTVSST